MTGQNDWQDESLTGQVHDQAGHCPLTGHYFQPWEELRTNNVKAKTCLFTGQVEVQHIYMPFTVFS